MKNFYQALNNFQSKCPLIKKDASNPFYNSKYAPLDDILPIVLPLLRAEGLAISQTPNGMTLETVIYHLESGEFLKGAAELVLDKQNSQGHGSAITYMRRYALVSMLGLNTEEDDDGNKASGIKVKQSKVGETVRISDTEELTAPACSICGNLMARNKFGWYCKTNWQDHKTNNLKPNPVWEKKVIEINENGHPF